MIKHSSTVTLTSVIYVCIDARANKLLFKIPLNLIRDYGLLKRTNSKISLMFAWEVCQQIARIRAWAYPFFLSELNFAALKLAPGRVILFYDLQ